MKILKVIHGYPPKYNAGSEVYSQLLCQALARYHQVYVFTRDENSLISDYEYIETQDYQDNKIKVHCINLPRERNLLKYSHNTINQQFSDICDQFKPDIVHIGHLNHLSIDIVDCAWQRKIPIVYTLHDYWLMCPRGQFLQRNSTPPFALCQGQEDIKCAKKCFSGFISSDSKTNDETHYWSDWVKRRTDRFREICQRVSLFIAPSRYLQERFIEEFNLPKKKIMYLDYGFNRMNLSNRVRVPEDNFVFGYIGTHIPAKGIQDLIDAFSKLETTKPCFLKLWGRFRSDLTPVLQEKLRHLPHDVSSRIYWMGEYTNNTIVNEVFNYVDAIVVPSIWVENSPLVIHEAQELRIPVITANMGGMAEYVQHEVNGLLFEPRNIADLAKQMSILANNPEKAKQLGERGYLYSTEGNIPDIEKHVFELESIYKELKHEK
jgi:glycosyltransferase involved in cell wall biosynthesis